MFWLEIGNYTDSFSTFDWHDSL